MTQDSKLDPSLILGGQLIAQSMQIGGGIEHQTLTKWQHDEGIASSMFLGDN